MKEFTIRIRLVWGEIRRALLYGTVAAVLTITLAFAAAARVNRDAEVIQQQQTTLILEQARETQNLLCDILAEAQTKEVRQAVRQYCPEPVAP